MTFQLPGRYAAPSRHLLDTIIALGGESFPAAFSIQPAAHPFLSDSGAFNLRIRDSGNAYGRDRNWPRVMHTARFQAQSIGSENLRAVAMPEGRFSGIKRKSSLRSMPSAQSAA